MSRRPSFAAALVLVILLAAIGTAWAVSKSGSGGASGVVPLKKGDRIVFLGDSITAGAVGPSGFITIIQADLAKNRADLGIECIGAGISGNKVPDLQKRLQKDVLDKKPTIVFIYIGINDVWHWNPPKSKGTEKGPYEEGLKDIIARITAAGARVILCTPTVIGEKPDGTNPRDAMLDEYSDISRKVARETHTQLLDLRKAFLAFEKANNKENKASGILTRDGVHLIEAGNRLVAQEMLGALGVEAAKVE